MPSRFAPSSIAKVRRSFALGIWLAVTATATAMVWTAVSVVAADVTDRPAPVVAHRDVVGALGGSSPGPAPAAATTTTAKAAPSPPTSVARGTPGSVVASVPSIPQPKAPFLPFSPTGVTTIAPSGPPATKAAGQPPPTSPAPPPVVAYSTPGGVVTVACTSQFTIRLVSATPNDGFQVNVVNAGPGQVQVDLVSPDHSYRVSAVCLYGQPFRLPQYP